MQATQVSFSNTEIAFKRFSNSDLRKAEWLFRSFNYPWLVRNGPSMASFAVSLGMKSLIKNTIFHHFCGGEHIGACSETIDQLYQFGVGTILDYSVEGEEEESVFEETCREIIRTIERAAGNEKIPFSVFKTTGIARFALLEKIQTGAALSADEQSEWEAVRSRFSRICRSASEHKVRIFVDAEESWIQDPIDQLTMEMMHLFNRERAIVYNTIQLYRHDRLEFLKKTISGTPCYLGFKLVRGAYMEKERARAGQMGYRDPIQPDKAAADRDYNEALKTCLEHIDRVSVCAGTHNEDSSRYLMQLMEEHHISPQDERVYFSQLLGMSDHISFNLANAGYRVAKYVPYGPVKAVLPYLGRRAQENSAMAGQMGRELAMIRAERQRRSRG
ncbi:MAG: proline dehydrogenase family protein [Bacteroidetes bacterium]|nr:proline dehydrogenase family protein [Bacteroidota bacterium]